MVNLVTLLLCVVPMNDAVEDFVDLTEIQHFHDEQGRLVFDQVVFFNFDWHSGRHQVVAWRMLKSHSQVPQYSHRLGVYVATWQDTQNGDIFRRVYSRSYRETWGQSDVELVERGNLPKEHRSELTRGPSTSMMPSLLNTDEGKRIILERLRTTGCSRK